MGQLKIVLLNVMFYLFLTFASKANGEFGGTTTELFKKNNKRNYLFSVNTQNYLYFGSGNDKSLTEANLGLDAPLITVTRSSGRVYSLGIPAMIHLNMYPEENVFHVDNFYAEFGIWIQIDFNKQVSLRISPLHHRSAHLSDGYLNNKSNDTSLTGDISIDKQRVSNEMIYAELLYAPIKIKGLEIKGAAGYYYHTNDRKYLRGRLDLDLFYNMPLDFVLTPAILFKNVALYEKGFRYGFDGAIGAELKSKAFRGVGFYFRFFDIPHKGQYLYESEEGIGFNLRLIL